MIQVEKIKKLKNNFPVLVGNKAVSSKICKKLIEEINKSEAFDDMIMDGRSRINKGSKNFAKYLSNSTISSKLFNQLNNKTFYKKIERLFKKIFKDGSWSNTYEPKIFNKNKFTVKKKVNSSELKKMLGVNYQDPIVNLDMDFSVSKGGYHLKPHRDDITRLYNFLIYLNNIPKKNDGSLILYKKKKNKELRKSFRRFPKTTELNSIKEFNPKQGTVIFFQSTPNSYHGVKKFKENMGQKRYFIYGSYALNKPVIWSFQNNKYYPVIINNRKKMLTSFHDSNYLIKNKE